MITAALNDSVRVAQPDHPDWDAYVGMHPKGSIFHTRAMIRVFAETEDIEPYALAAVNDDGNIIALLASFHIKTLKDFPSMSSRAVQYAEPLCDPTPEGIAALTGLVALHDECMRSRALLAEVRMICAPCIEDQALSLNGYERRDYINFVVDLKTDSDLLWKKVHRRMRQKIRSSHRKGVVVRDDNSSEGIDRFYSLLQSSYARARVPLSGRDLFDNTCRALPSGCVRLRTAFHKDKPVASVMTLAFGNRLYSWYGGTQRVHGISAFACIVWEDIVWGCQNGFTYYDFGGAGWPHEDYGPRRFKANFGGREVHYGRYVLTYSKLRLRIAEVAYGISRQIGTWSRQQDNALHARLKAGQGD